MGSRIANRIRFLGKRIIEERAWIESHGRTLDAYVERYGEADDPNKCGDGGEAIYNADVNTFKRLAAEFEALTGARVTL